MHKIIRSAALATCLLVSLLSVNPASVAAQHKEVPVTDAFKVTGLVKNELKLTIKDLLRFKSDSLGTVVITNKHGEQKSISRQIRGVLLKTILDSAAIAVDKPKEYSEVYITLIASDDYKNVYSWNELFNNEVGNHVYIITEMDGVTIDQMKDRILVMSLSDIKSGSRHLKGLASIDVRKVR